MIDICVESGCLVTDKNTIDKIYNNKGIDYYFHFPECCNGMIKISVKEEDAQPAIQELRKYGFRIIDTSLYNTGQTGASRKRTIYSSSTFW